MGPAASEKRVLSCVEFSLTPEEYMFTIALRRLSDFRFRSLCLSAKDVRKRVFLCSLLHGTPDNAADLVKPEIPTSFKKENI
jgi:hypothetical protein